MNHTTGQQPFLFLVSLLVETDGNCQAVEMDLPVNIAQRRDNPEIVWDIAPLIAQLNVSQTEIDRHDSHETELFRKI